MKLDVSHIQVPDKHCCNECGALATHFVANDPDGDPESYWCEEHKNRIDCHLIGDQI